MDKLQFLALILYNVSIDVDLLNNHVYIGR